MPNKLTERTLTTEVPTHMNVIEGGAVKRSAWSAFMAHFTALFAPLTRTISAAGLASGGGTLAADRTITVTAASQAEAEAGSATGVAMTPQRTAQAITALAPAALTTQLAAKAPLASPAFTGVPTVPTAATTTNTTQAASTAFVQQELNALLDGAPGALNTLNELAAAVNDDASYAATITAALGGKLAASHASVTNARTPTGAAGGVLSGSYPNPSFSMNMATVSAMEAALPKRVTVSNRLDSIEMAIALGRSQTVGDVVKQLGLPEATAITVLADVAGHLNGRYFAAHDADATVGFYFITEGRKNVFTLDFNGWTPTVGFFDLQAYPHGIYDGDQTAASIGICYVDFLGTAADIAGAVRIYIITYCGCTVAIDGAVLTVTEPTFAPSSFTNSSTGIPDSALVDGCYPASAPGVLDREVGVTILNDSTAEEVAEALYDAIILDGVFSAVLLDDLVTLTNPMGGDYPCEDGGNATAFNFTRDQVGTSDSLYLVTDTVAGEESSFFQLVS